MKKAGKDCERGKKSWHMPARKAAATNKSLQTKPRGDFRGATED